MASDAGGAETIGTAPDGSPVARLRLARGGVTATVISWGASLTGLWLDGVPWSLALGSGDFAPYPDALRYFGAVVGPVANRIAGGRMTVGDRLCDLDRNEGGVTTLHGGRHGWGSRNWTVKATGPSDCRLSLVHPDGLDGFPGPIRAEVAYTLDDAGALRIDIAATTDTPTRVAPAFHGYWNLDGGPDILGHRLTVHAETYLPVDARMIPTGDPQPVAGTDFDHRSPRPPSPGLDHNFCIGPAQGPLRPVCRLEAGRVALDVLSTEPGLQVYAGRKIDTGPHPGHGGRPYGPHAGIALEPQGWPDAANRPGWPPTLLLPGQTYRQATIFRATSNPQ